MRSYENVRKFYWVDWNTICLDNENGGLRISRIWEFIQTLEKQCWRIYVEQKSLSYKVLMAMYEIEGGRIREGKRL